MNRMQSMMMRTLLAGSLAAGIAAGAGAQISEGGIPPSFRYEQTLRSRAAATGPLTSTESSETTRLGVVSEDSVEVLVGHGSK